MLKNISFMTNSMPLVVFLVGVYAGIFVDQHYQIPRVDDPKEMWKKVEEFANKHKKDRSD